MLAKNTKKKMYETKVYLPNATYCMSLCNCVISFVFLFSSSRWMEISYKGTELVKPIVCVHVRKISPAKRSVYRFAEISALLPIPYKNLRVVI